jgi:hypothetical protein
MTKSEDKKVSLGFLLPLPLFDVLIAEWSPKTCHGQEDHQPTQSTKKSVRLVPVGGGDLVIR